MRPIDQKEESKGEQKESKGKGLYQSLIRGIPPVLSIAANDAYQMTW
jgi:hypothetical protein